MLSIDSSGVVSVFAALPPRASAGACSEDYIAVAGPADLSLPLFPSPTKGGFTSNYAYVMLGPDIKQISLAGVITHFATIAGCQASHNGITFDRVGTFGWKMIVVCNDGKVWTVTSAGVATQIADIAAALPLESVFVENPDVAPQSFGAYGGYLFVAAEQSGRVYAVSPPPSYTVVNVAGWDGAEGVNFIPSNKCTFGASGGAFFTAIFQSGAGSIYKFPWSAFSAYPGHALITSETGSGIGRLPPGSSIVLPFHGNIGQHEGSTFVDCTVPLLLKIIVKPGSIPHTINPRSEGRVPVAILSSPTFNALTQTIQSSIRAGVKGTENSLAFCNPSGQDVNGDGLLDLMCHFTTQKLGITTPGVYRGPLILKMLYSIPGGDPPGEGFD